MIKQIPNILTMSRLIGAPLLAIGLLSWFGPTAQWTLFILYVICALTDTLDGNIARWLDARSTFGRVMDSISDKVLTVCVATALVAQGYILNESALLVMLILFRETVVSGLREALSEMGKGEVLQVSVAGKTKMVIQLICWGAYILTPAVPQVGVIAQLLLYVATLVTLYSGLEYVRVGLHALSSSSPPNDDEEDFDDEDEAHIDRSKGEI